VVGVIILFTLLLLIDRFYWAQISQWREDQATNLWLGYTMGVRDIPVGLMSSKGIPNPNGMVLLGFFLSALPNLLSVSFFLGFVQMILLVLVGWKSSGKNWQYFLLVTIPTLSSVILRSSSVEYWNQYTITLVNIFFIFWLLRYLENLSLWNLPPITVLILLAPSLYLAGLANAIVMTLLTFGVLVYKRPSIKYFRVVLIVILLLVILSLFLTWLPYFQNVSLTQITDYNKTKPGPVILFQKAWAALFGFPIYAILQWADKSTFALAFKHADSRILSLAAQWLLWLTGRAYLLQVVFAFITSTAMIFTILHNRLSAKPLNWTINAPAARMAILSALFIVLSYTFSAWLGGPAWVDNERLDQTVQFLPMFLILIFLLPLIISVDGRAEKTINRISYGSLVVFGTVNLLCGLMIIRDHLQYRGNALTEADVPLTDKMQVLNFVTSDWKIFSNSNIIPVDYDLGGEVWDWVPEFGLALTPWYPAPMTTGRSFDYELLRQYGLSNYQEGVQLRAFGTGRYLITYVFEDTPQVAGAHIASYIFGRLSPLVTS
jgi:hypothetical protein